MKKIRYDILLFLLLAYAAASLFHYVHNAVFLDDYPNMPAWLSPVHVYSAWLGVTAVGAAGFLLVHRNNGVFGLVILGVYAALGLDGMSHYSLAPISAHTFTMNLSIWLETLTAVTLLITVSRIIATRLWGQGGNARQLSS